MVRRKQLALRPKRLRNVVYVVGAGFSAGLGYPLTKSLLVEAWEWLDPDAQERLAQVIRFHHPAFDPERRTTFPNIEQLLSEIAVNLDLFKASRPLQGKLSPDDLRDAQMELLGCIGERFHEQYDRACETPWLRDVVNRIHSENAAVISFNWDLVLDHLLFQDGLSARGYGLSTKLGSGALLLKPHGSLNWYDAGQTRKVKVGKRTTIFSHKDSKKQIKAFLLPSARHQLEDRSDVHAPHCPSDIYEELQGTCTAKAVETHHGAPEHTEEDGVPGLFASFCRFACTVHSPVRLPQPTRRPNTHSPDKIPGDRPS